jgi:hypothetical protein
MGNKFYTPIEIARMWSLDPKVVREIFSKEPGVLKLERPATRLKPKHTTLRIPPDVVERVQRRMSVR